MFMATDSVRRAEIIEVMSSGRTDIAAALLLAMADFDGATALTKVSVPVLAIGSAAPTNASSDLTELCSTMTIGQTVGAGHFNHLEVPEQVNPMIERFLAINM
jgi:pimeloyl-ACP methyl ester carboxylesterase